MLIGADPRDLLHHLLMDSTQIPEQVDDLTLWKVRIKKFNAIVHTVNISLKFMLSNILVGFISDYNCRNHHDDKN